MQDILVRSAHKKVYNELMWDTGEGLDEGLAEGIAFTPTAAVFPDGAASVKTSKTKKHAKKEHEAKKQVELLRLLVQLEGI